MQNEMSNVSLTSQVRNLLQVSADNESQIFSALLEQLASVENSVAGINGKIEDRDDISIYRGPTRLPGDGFDEDVMYLQFQQLPSAVVLAIQVSQLGFRYVGDTQTSSKANTDFTLKTIRIHKELSPDEAALSLVYELKNAQQMQAFEKILLLLKKKGTVTLAHTYAEGILRREAKSVLIRSQMAVAMNAEPLIKNQRYNEIAKDRALSDPEKESAIFEEMRQHGMVHQGNKKAYAHYVEQFWQYCQH